MQDNSKITHINKGRIPVIPVEVAPEIKFITPHLLSGIKTRLKEIETKASDAASALESWVDHSKKYDLKRFAETTLAPLIEQAYMSNGAILRFMAIEALNQIEILIERARQSITDSEKIGYQRKLGDIE